jgi:hypothetical protein
MGFSNPKTYNLLSPWEEKDHLGHSVGDRSGTRGLSGNRAEWKSRTKALGSWMPGGREGVRGGAPGN